MKSKSLLFLISLILFISISAFGADVKITPPDGWKKVEQASPNLLPTYSKGTSSFTVAKDILPLNIKTIDEYIAFVKPKFEKQFKDIKYEDVKKVTINDKDARELIFVSNMYGIKMKFLIGYFINNKSVYSLTCCAMLSDFDSVKDDFENFISTFKLQ